MREADKRIYGVLEPGSVLKPGTPPRTPTRSTLCITWFSPSYVQDVCL